MAKKGPKNPLSKEHKAAMAVGRIEGRVVRDYLEALRNNKPKRGRKRTAETIQARLDAIEQQAQTAFLQEAKRVSKARHKAAPQLAQAITHAMQGLGMQGGRLEVQLSPSAPPTATGLEQVQFLVAGHPGSTPRPVGKVASGGELSRIALAIAVTTSQLGLAQTLIFDEVDAGVGGAVTLNPPEEGLKAAQSQRAPSPCEEPGEAPAERPPSPSPSCC